MRIVNLDNHKKVPVLENVIYAFGLIWRADKLLFIGYLMQNIAKSIFDVLIQNVLFLKVLLTVIEGQQDFAVYVKYLFMFAGASLVSKLIQWLGCGIEKFSTKRVLKRLNNMVFEKAGKLDISCYEDPEFYNKYQRAVNVMEYGYFDILCYDLSYIAGSLLSFVFVVGTISFINPIYLLFLLPAVFVFAVEIYKSRCVYQRDMKMTSNNRIKAYIQRTVFLKEYSKDMRTSNIFAVLMKRFDMAVKSNIAILRKYGFKLFLYSMLSSLLNEFIPIIGTYAVAAYQFSVKGNMTVSGFSVILSSVNFVRNSAMDIAECFDELSQMAMYFQNLKEFFAYEPKVISGKRQAGVFESLELKNVSFRYPSAEKNSINNLNIKINRGETVAVVGINGAGKSTLVKLLLRFYDVSDGEILYNGINIKEYDINSLRSRFATVFQDYKNFALSVYENVMCQRCSDKDKELAKNALIKSGVWNKISSLEKGGDTLLSREFDEKGAGLSGGENQKISTARLFAKKFDIAILDEPSSALDPIAEYEMYENLVSATRDKTVMYISHRLSSAVLSDKIYVLGGGRLLESGTHSELMAAGGEYAEMFEMQSKSYREEADYEN